ncbi:hypothetical protein PP348_20275 [Mycobacteroides abscessus]|uniref:hypothetical protein n=1 Tax=Mycobacteroides abscessus TaxID=36809 RepID=UPI002104C1E7|nr:hypothetical protein [Mycobacteroides abscessus]MDM2096413.1 hypothetical protein [Mycobacteroides abscessus]MDM2121144.1 hypothetical protein [Mycobacteroides abscessus]MDM2124361.1 hypothetical protein [Mycobacteroides abscessus]MDM2130546.1 hypothetical protein [Mycobacteroides abscessus]MDM2203065.1 hypothetical protein [Mycobacteroides abscessus]
MAAEIENADGSPDTDRADGEFQQPLPDWVKAATDRFMASSIEEQVALTLELKRWSQNQGDLEGVQHAERLLQSLRYAVANPSTLDDPASDAL